jgi:hypothetical protein
MEATEFIITALGTGTVLEVTRAVIASFKSKKEGDTSLQLADKSELYNFRQWLANEVESLTEISEKIKEEKHQLELKIVNLERDLIDARRLTSEQDEEILKLNADCESLKTRIAHFTNISQHEVVIDE